MKTQKTLGHSRSMTLSILAVAAMALGLLAPARAGVILIQPTEAKESTFFSIRDGGKTRDGSGLSNTSIVETGDPVPSTWPSHTANLPTLSEAADEMWLSGNAGSEGDEWVMFDLGAEYTIGGLHQWNYNEAGSAIGNGIKGVTIKFATSGTGYANGDQSHADWVNGYATEFAQATGANTYTGETINFLDGSRTARYILLDTETAWATTYNRTGLSEIRFITVPEPSTLALFGLAAAASLLGCRRRHRSH